jgi:photosynthetic reaction center cytochrome c subunit
MLTPRTVYILVWMAMAGLFISGTFVIVWWIYNQLQLQAEPAPPPSPVYAAYSNLPSDYLKPESLAAMTAYTNANPQPQAVEVLTGWSTAQISQYMVSQVSGGLKVDCSYCHNVANFAQGEGYPNAVNKTRARAMMLMTADLNQNHVAKLPTSVGAYETTCATCHNGRPQFETYPAKIQNTLPAAYKLPLNLDYPGGLVVTGRDDVGLEDVTLNQQTMYHMNVSLGQGCTFCHNARYFPSYEVDQKQYATWMLQMSKHIQETYVAPGGNAAQGIMAGKSPSCWMCHQGARIPPGAVLPGQSAPQLSARPEQAAQPATP